MNRTARMIELAREMPVAVRVLQDGVPPGDLDGPSTWEIWNPADALTHCAEWLRVDLERVARAGELVPVMKEGELEVKNREFYAAHAGKTWDEATARFGETADAVLGLLQHADEGLVETAVRYSNGTERPIWRSLAGHCGLHISWHLGIILGRHGASSAALEYAQRVHKLSLPIGEDARWKAANQYDLAVSYAWAGHPSDALRELRNAFAHQPDLREFAGTDEDLVSLRDRDDFQQELQAT